MGGVDWGSILSLIGTTLNYLSLIVQKKTLQAQHLNTTLSNQLWFQNLVGNYHFGERKGSNKKSHPRSKRHPQLIFPFLSYIGTMILYTIWCYKGMMLQRYDVTKVWCYKGMMLQRYDVTKVWCYKSMMLQKYDVTKVWYYKSMMLQRLLPLLQAGPSYFGWQSHLNFQYTLGSSSHWALSLLHNVSLSQGEGNPK